MKTLENILTNAYENKNLEIWFSKIYKEVEEYSLFLDISNIGGICVDVGANVGAFSIRYGQYFKNMYCIEPADGNIKYIEKMALEKNILNIKTIKKAVSDIDNQIIKLRPLIFEEKNKWDGIGSLGNLSTQLVSIEENVGWQENDIFEPVESISLEGIFKILYENKHKSIDLLKVDCEGSEYDFLYNKDLTMIKYIVAEIHSFLGKEKQELLLKHILKTHNIIRHGPPGGNFTISFKSKFI